MCRRYLGTDDYACVLRQDTAERKRVPGDRHVIDADSFRLHPLPLQDNQRGDIRPEDIKPPVGTAAAAMQEWLAVLKAHGVDEGSMFR